MRKMFTENMKSIFTEDMLKKYDENTLNVLKEVWIDILNVKYEEANKKIVVVFYINFFIHIKNFYLVVI